MSADTTGLVNLGTFTKFIRWSVDTQCLLDGSAGQVVAVSVLLPSVNKPATNPAVAAGLAAVEATGTILALSTTKSSFIVALRPEPRVMFKWDRPADVDESVLPTLAWARAKVYSNAAQGGAGFACPVLARGWGNRLQLLQVQPVGGYMAAHPSPGRLQFVPVDDLRTTSVVSALDWLSESVLVYMNADYNLVVFDTVALEELETKNISQLKLVYATFGSVQTAARDPPMGPVPTKERPHVPAAVSFQNSFRACHNTLCVVCPPCVAVVVRCCVAVWLCVWTAVVCRAREPLSHLALRGGAPLASCLPFVRAGTCWA